MSTALTEYVEHIGIIDRDTVEVESHESLGEWLDKSHSKGAPRAREILALRTYRTNSLDFSEIDTVQD